MTGRELRVVPPSGEVLDAPTLVRHAAGDILGADLDDPAYLMCSECGAIGYHTRGCSSAARPVTPRERALALAAVDEATTEAERRLLDGNR